MRSAVDTSVLLDVFSESPQHLKGSRQALLKALSEGSLVACDVVWAETRAHFPSQEEFQRAMTTLGVAFDSSDTRCAEAAGEAWRRYRRRGGKRTRLVPDFLVAAHALVRADRFLTRDRGFTRDYFAGLTVLDPSRSS
ncbi:MAG TPA: PIN domain-containing protein [Thermoanaerobaculia bacterium]|nr:PIN domain-containing protein [Thermoanaerobaculia bacterium]